MQQISEILLTRNPRNESNNLTLSDVKLTFSSKDGFSVIITLHHQILVAHSRFFSIKLSERWIKLEILVESLSVVEILEYNDVEVYI